MAARIVRDPTGILPFNFKHLAIESLNRAESFTHLSAGIPSPLRRNDLLFRVGLMCRVIRVVRDVATAHDLRGAPYPTYGDGKDE
jgi:hypothetical protein